MTQDLDKIRGSVLDRMDRSTRLMKVALIGAAIAEAALLGEGIVSIDFSVRQERVMYLLFLAAYMIITLGMIALGAHISRTAYRVISALEKH